MHYMSTGWTSPIKHYKVQPQKSHSWWCIINIKKVLNCFLFPSPSCFCQILVFFKHVWGTKTTHMVHLCFCPTNSDFWAWQADWKRCTESPWALLCCIPVNPWLLGAMGKGLCCIASWWSLVSCGEIAAEEDCESERGGRERNGGNGKHRKREKQNKNNTVSTDSYTKNLQQQQKKISHIAQYCCV